MNYKNDCNILHLAIWLLLIIFIKTNTSKMKRKGLFALIVTIVAMALGFSFVAKGSTTATDGYEMRPVAYFDFESTFNPDEYEVIDCCLLIPGKSCDFDHQDPRC